MSSHSIIENPWLPRASCDSTCVRTDTASHGCRRVVAAVRTSVRVCCALVLLSAAALLAVPMPGKARAQRI